jgi:hypothetical protein
MSRKKEPEIVVDEPGRERYRRYLERMARKGRP